MTPAFIRERLKNYEAKVIEGCEGICAGVVIPIFQKDGNVYIVLTKRSQTVSLHKGEVSFPGGMCEDEDGGTMNTALRECCEEIGVSAEDVEIIGKIDDMYTFTGFVITPYVGIIPYPYEFRTNPGEVAYMIFMPLKHLMEATPVMENVEHLGKTIMATSFDFNGDRIWGATCRILFRLKRILEDEKI
ncbi:MAG: CoA pyrophosphatase [Syntrophobacterales bacterium]|jgi:8-oxo-dGTP pyrophosphatase MutT (NUDIX family)|nr:CoA pyrophosphatase [Syntrophobacterales bacterium]